MVDEAEEGVMNFWGFEVGEGFWEKEKRERGKGREEGRGVGVSAGEVREEMVIRSVRICGKRSDACTKDDPERLMDATIQNVL